MIENKKVLAVTLAREGSKRVKKKNTATLDGKTLIRYTIDEVRKSKFIDKYVISTDCTDVKRICKWEKVEAIDRPEYLATDTAKSSDALIHAVQQIEEEYDIIVEVMSTNPLKNSEDIDGCISKLVNMNAESVVSVSRIWDHHPSRVKFLDENDVMNDFYPEELESRRQDLTPPSYVRNGSIYVMTKDFLLREKTRYNKRSIAYIMPEERSINIDEQNDFRLCEILIKANKIDIKDETYYSVY